MQLDKNDDLCFLLCWFLLLLIGCSIGSSFSSLVFLLLLLVFFPSGLLVLSVLVVKFWLFV